MGPEDCFATSKLYLTGKAAWLVFPLIATVIPLFAHAASTSSNELKWQSILQLSRERINRRSIQLSYSINFA